MVPLSNHYFSSNPDSKLEKGLIITTLRGRKFELLTASGIFSVKHVDTGTRVLIENMKIPEQGNLLDLGCGNGVIGVVAASLNPELHVTLSDVNRRATQLARENVRRMGLRNVTVLTGDLYEPVVGLRFDTIVCNPPISAGMKRVVRRIVYEAPGYLVEGGSLQLVIQSRKGGKTLAGYLENVFGGFTILERKSGFRVLLAD